MSTPINQLNRVNYVHVGKHGTFYQDSNTHYGSSYKDIDALFEHLEKTNKSKLLLYFHGGLVSTKDGMITAERVIRYADKTDAHPFCFVWETGWLKTVTDNLVTISKSEFFKRVIAKVLKVTGSRIGIEFIDSDEGAKGIGQLIDAEIYAELQKEAPFENYRIDSDSKSASVIAYEQESKPNAKHFLEQELMAELEDEIEGDPSFYNIEFSKDEESLLSPEYKVLEDGNAKGLFTAASIILGATKVALRVIERFVNRRNHDFFPTVAEEAMRELYMSDLGNWLWGNMKEKAAQMWQPNNFNGDDKLWPVGSYFFSKLNDFQESYRKKTGKQLIIDLVGHSAGSIVICQIINMMVREKYNFKFRNIIFMAPACRNDLFSETILKNSPMFDSFRCFTMSDIFEKKDHLVSFVYPRSLLYLISGILEEEADTQILGLQRHTVGNRPYNDEHSLEIADYLRQPGHTVYAVTDESAQLGFQCTAIKHGGFANENESTLSSIMYIINQ